MTPSPLRYDLTPFVNSSRHSVQEIQDPEYKKLEAKYATALQSKVNDPNFQRLFRNKTIAALFLDKVPKFTGTHHPDAKLVEKFGYSSSTILSMEIIRYLESVRNAPRLTQESKAFLEDWIERESDYLGLAIIFDGWRSANAEIMQQLAKGDVSSNVRLSAPEEEVKKVAVAISTKLSHLSPGQKFKMLGGYNIHETRVLLKKEQDGTFSLFHFNTAALNKSVEKFIFPPEVITNPTFWENFIKAKLGETSIYNMLTNFNTMGKRDFSVAEDESFLKTLQRSNTCPAQAVEAELRYERVLKGPTPEEGLIQYKLIKSLMAEKAVREERGQIDPHLFQILESKERSKHRYLHWWHIVQNPQQYEQIKDAYVELIKLTNPYADQLENLDKKLASTTSKISLLRFLDDLLEMKLAMLPRDEREKIFQKNAQLFQVDQTPILCLKRVEASSRVRGAVHEILEVNKKNAGGFWKYARTLLNHMPTFLASTLDTKLRSDTLTKEELLKLLSSYLGQEKPINAVPIIQEMLSEGLISRQDLDELIQKAGEPLKTALAKNL